MQSFMFRFQGCAVEFTLKAVSSWPSDSLTPNPKPSHKPDLPNIAPPTPTPKVGRKEMLTPTKRSRSLTSGVTFGLVWV